jgi:hypothetical protein
MQELKHALTGGIYGIDPEDGLVRVEEAGKVGWFDSRGHAIRQVACGDAHGRGARVLRDADAAVQR